MTSVTRVRLYVSVGSRYAGMQGYFRPSVTPVLNKFTFEPIIAKNVPFVLNNEGVAAVMLPHTDQAAIQSQFHYATKWVSGYSTPPPAKSFILPQAFGNDAVYNSLVELPDRPGIFAPSVPVPTPPPTPPTTPPTTPDHSDEHAHFHHYQNTPAASWIIDHNLGSPCPVVTLIIDGRLVYSDVTYVGSNRISISWPVPTVGEAHISK